MWFAPGLVVGPGIVKNLAIRLGTVAMFLKVLRQRDNVGHRLTKPGYQIPDPG